MPSPAAGPGEPRSNEDPLYYAIYDVLADLDDPKPRTQKIVALVRVEREGQDRRAHAERQQLLGQIAELGQQLGDERARREHVEAQRDRFAELCAEFNEAMEAERETVAALLDLHIAAIFQVGGPARCRECLQVWPCRSVRVLEARS